MKYLIILFLLAGCTPIPKPTTSMSFLDIAKVFVGMDEVENRKELRAFMGIDPSRIEWCAGFVNSILSTKGVPGSGSVSRHPLLARSFLKWGHEVTDGIQPGDIVVFPRGRAEWQGHVGFYVKTEYVDGIKHYLILGGNQDNAVTYELFPATFAMAVRRYPYLQ